MSPHTFEKSAVSIYGSDEDPFRVLVDAAPNPLIMVDAAGSVHIANAAAETFLGYARGGLLGLTVEQLIPARYRDQHHSYRESYLQEPTARPMGKGRDLFALRANGEQAAVEIGLTPVRLGEQVFVLVSLVDIGERLRTESELRRLAQNLEKSNKELEHFAYVASHDLQEPLRMVSSFLQLLEQRYGQALDGKAREYISFAVDGAKRLKLMINDLLEYSRVERKTLKSEPVEGEELIAIACRQIAMLVRDKNAEIRLSELPKVKGDKTLLVQLFQNLIANAVKFSRAGIAPVVEISAKRQGEMVRFAISDNGIGIAKDYAERIFVVFQRLHPQSEYEGTGIGLAVCKKIVELHGGAIEVESNPGSGSTFYCSIPAAE